MRGRSGRRPTAATPLSWSTGRPALRPGPPAARVRRQTARNPLNNRAKTQDEARFQVLRLLHEDPSLGQRDLGERVGLSLGAVNYCLKALVERGWVKPGNFSASPNKRGYSYLLTPTGIAGKGRLTSRFLARNKAEYDASG